MCDNQAAYRYTWPGEDESVVCEGHSSQLQAVASAIGIHLQIIPLSGKDLEIGLICNQKGGPPLYDRRSTRRGRGL